MAVGTSNLTNYASAFKRLYTTRTYQELMYEGRPLLGMMPKNTNFRGSMCEVHVDQGGSASRGHTFSSSQTYAATGRGSVFSVTRVQDFQSMYIDRQGWKASKGDDGAFFDLKKREMNGALRNLADNAHMELFRDGSAIRGIVGSESTTSLVLATPQDIKNFAIDMEVQVAAAGGSSVRSGTATITAIDYENYTLTTDTNWTSQIASLVATDEIYQHGDIDAGISGVAAWIDSSAGTLFGVTRTTDPYPLAGIWYTGTGMLYSVAIRKALHYASSFKSQGKKVGFVNPLVFSELLDEIGDKVRYNKMYAKGNGGKKIAHIDYDVITISSPFGDVEIVSDHQCQTNRIWLLCLEDWEFKTLGPFPDDLLDTGVTGALPVYNADSIELRRGWYGNAICHKPINNIGITITAPT
ncbi:MAG: hypothetical protein GY923_15455 [Aestuariibacter sp.]|nr:hypothetical protein [Aestuariibacter sp.]